MRVEALRDIRHPTLTPPASTEIRGRISRVLRAWRWGWWRLSGGCGILGRFLFGLGLHLGQQWGRIDPTPVKLTLVREKVLSIMLLQRVGPA